MHATSAAHRCAQHRQGIRVISVLRDEYVATTATTSDNSWHTVILQICLPFGTRRVGGVARVFRASFALQPLSRKRDIMLVHVIREYNLNKIFLSCLGLWPFQSKLARNCLPIFCLVLEISYYPFEVMIHSPNMIFDRASPFDSTQGWLMLCLDIDVSWSSRRRANGLRKLLSNCHFECFPREAMERNVESRQSKSFERWSNGIWKLISRWRNFLQTTRHPGVFLFFLSFFLIALIPARCSLT